MYGFAPLPFQLQLKILLFTHFTLHFLWFQQVFLSVQGTTVTMFNESIITKFGRCLNTYIHYIATFWQKHVWCITAFKMINILG